MARMMLGLEPFVADINILLEGYQHYTRSVIVESFVIGFFLLKMPPPLVDLVQCSVDAGLQFIFSGRQEPPSSDTELSADRS